MLISRLVERIMCALSRCASCVEHRDVELDAFVCVQGLIRLLSTCAHGSAAAAETLLLLRISNILKDVLAGSGLVSSTSVSPSSVNRPPEQVCFNFASACFELAMT